LSSLFRFGLVLSIIALVAGSSGVVACNGGPHDRPSDTLRRVRLGSGCQGFGQPLGIARAVHAYPALSFEFPVQLVHHPSEPYLYVVEQRGRILRFEDREDVEHAELVADLANEVGLVAFDDGLIGLAFDPDFVSNGDAVIKYMKKDSEDETGSLRLALARIHSDDGGVTFASSSVQDFLVLERGQDMHHGGPPKYGPDGFLWIPMGDGGWEPELRSQELSRLEGKMLRIDTRATPYAVPPDNPFVGQEGVRPEIWAYGLRNPYGFAFDGEEGDGWIGDVGLHSWEEVNRLQRGANYGWPVREGLHCSGLVVERCASPGFVDPVYEYPNAGGAAISMGFVYRGAKMPSARGRVVFADSMTGQFEALDPNATPAASRHLLDAPVGPTNIIEDESGEVLFATYPGQLFRLEERTEPGMTVPSRLSETGCVDVSSPKTFPFGVEPYDVNMPLWSDGTDKARGLALPPGAKIAVLEDGSWDAPSGTVVVKSFFANDRPIETRLLVRHDDGNWAGYSYEWDEEGADATLVEHGKRTQREGLDWLYPGRNQCVACHTGVGGRTLGLSAAQWNRDEVYERGRTENQIAHFDRLGYFDRSPGAPSALPRFPERLDASASDEAWARAYLHANCSHCHQPGGTGWGNFDFRHQASNTAAGCGVDTLLDPLGSAAPRVFAPGAPHDSVALLRMQSTEALRMPPLGTSLVDDLAIERLRSWNDRTTCE